VPTFSIHATKPVVVLSPEAEKRIRNEIAILKVEKKERVKIINQNQFFLEQEY
jgi:hypothetical protein